MLRQHLVAGAGLFALTVSTIPVVAHAQASGDQALTVEAVVVTARKREERLQDVPISANVTGGDKIEAQHIDALKGLDLFVPNLFIQPTPGNQSVYIRGFGSTAGNFGFEQSVGLFVDGVYAGRARQFAAPFLDVERVEVLRGPQGALFGKNTSAGAINITSRGPTTTFTGETMAVGQFQGDRGYELTQILSGPLSDTLGARLALKASKTDGFLTNTTTGGKDGGQTNLVGRLTLDYHPTDQFSARLKVESASQELDGQPMVSVPFVGGHKSFSRATTPGVPDFDHSHSFNAALTANYDLSSGYLLTSITGYSQFSYNKLIDSDFTAAPILQSSFGEQFSQTSQELRITAPSDGRFTWIAGLYYHRNKVDLQQGTTITAGPYNGSQTRLFGQDGDTTSLYAQGTFKITDKLRATLGVRQTWDSKEAYQTRGKSGVVPATWLTTPLSGSRDEQAFDPSGQIQYSFDDDTMAYVSYGRGSKAGGFVAAQSTTTQAQFQFNGERATSLEVGLKTALFERRVRLDIALYQTKYEDLQVSVFNALTNAFITGNAASATSRGVEVESQARLTSWLDFTGSLAFLDAKYDDFPGAGCIYPLPVPTPSPCYQNIGGSRIPRAPRWTGAVGLKLNYPLDSDLRLTGGLDVAYRSDAFLEETLNPASRQAPYTKLDLRLGLAGADGRWEVSVIGKNLTDKLTASHAFGTPFVTGSETFVIDPPRVIAIQGKLHY